MAYLGGMFDATQVEPGGVFEVVPAGEYRIIISDSAMEQAKSGGQFLKLTLQIVDGPHQGVTLFDRLNLINSNDKAVEIAQRTLSAICHAVGVLQVQDSAQLHNRPLLAKVALNPGGQPDGKGGVYGPSNDVKGYKSMTQGHPASPTPPAAFPPPAAAAPAPAFQPPTAAPVNAAPPPSAVPPWMQKKVA